jgi:release factor glutamine methyltransferase
MRGRARQGGGGVAGLQVLEAVHGVARELDEAGVPSPRVDAEHLVAHVLGQSRTQLYSSDRQIGEEELLRLRSLVDRRRAREPLAYVLGEWGFRRLMLGVDRRVLVPRPETEMVVERCLALIRDLAEPRVLDVGTGSGAIALSLADEHSGVRVTAVDRSAEALAVVEANRELAGVDGRVQILQSDLLAAVTGRFDLVVSNPPYVDAGELETLEPEVRDWEPREALVDRGQTDRIAGDARRVLRPGGWLVLECADGRADRVARLLQELGYASVGKTQDLAGHERVVEGRFDG